MARNLSVRSVWTLFAMTTAVVILAAGCSSSSQPGDRDDAATESSLAGPAEASPPALKTPAEEGPSAIEPEALSDHLTAKPILDPEKVGPSQLAELPREPDVELVSGRWGSGVRRSRTAPSGTAPAPKPGAAAPAKRPGEDPAELVNPLRKPTDKAAEGPKPGEKKPRKGKRSGVPFDPIKENGPIFVGWPKPKLALVITGRQDGYIEPCGCAGLDRMKGGMGRRDTLFKTLRQQGWPVVGVDVGGLAKGFGREAELKFHTMVEGMRKMGYSAIALGASDLRLPAGELVAVAAGGGGQQGPFLSANVGLFGFAAGVTPKMRVVEAGGMKIGITAVLGKKFKEQVRNDEIEIADPEKALEEVLTELKKEKADFLVLLAYAGVEESVALAKNPKLRGFSVVVTAGGPSEPPARATPIEGAKALLVEVGEKGMDAVVLGLFDDPEQPIRYQRVPLDSRFANSPDMKLLMTAYQDQLKTLGLLENIRAVPHPQKDLLGSFVASQKCESCHEESYRVWKKSKHAKAYDTLAELDPPRDYDPECVSCHVVGWNAQKFFPYQSGYRSPEKTPQLKGVGCDDCHGPGEAHVIAEQGSNVALQKKLQKALVITKAEAADAMSKKQNCRVCHDLDNSPDFDFDDYWPDVAHTEK